MPIAPGTILISPPTIDDTNFEEVVIFITEHNEKGAMGFVINKLFARPLNALEEFKQSIAFPLYDGGPVDQKHLFFVHQRPDLIEGGTAIRDNIYFGGNFKQALTHLNKKIILQNDIKIFIGYCGWDYGQLEEEITEGSWMVVDAKTAIVFSIETTMLWKELYNSVL